MIWWINFTSNAIVLAVCLWAVLNPRVHTKIVGTVSMSSLGLFSAMNILKPGFAGVFSIESQTFANASLACLALWFYVRYQHYLTEGKSHESD
jgi:hypothetical protein